MTIKEQMDYMDYCLQIAKAEINKHSSNISYVKDNLRNVARTANRMANDLTQQRLWEENDER